MNLSDRATSTSRADRVTPVDGVTVLPEPGVGGRALVVGPELGMAARRFSATLAIGGILHRCVNGFAQALEELERQTPSLVLLDVALPNGDALKLCRHIKEQPSTHHIAVLLVGGSDDDAERIRAFEAGADGYFDQATHSKVLLSRAQAAIRTCVFNRELRERRHALKSELALLKSWGESLAHDLRGPLAAVAANLSFAAKRLPSGDTELQDAVSESEDGLRRVENLIRDLLDHDRLANGLLGLTVESADIGLLARQVAAEMEPLARLHSASVKVAGEGRVRCDVSLTRRVIWNLVANALKYSPPGAPVTVTVGSLRSSGGAWVAVNDRGPGVPRHVRDRLFTLYACDPSDPRRGSGIGLSFCKRVVEAHGGQIELDDPPGGGASFVFSLPGP